MRVDPTSLGITVAVHALVLYGVLAHNSIRVALADAAPLIVRLITAPPQQQVQPPAPLKMIALKAPARVLPQIDLPNIGAQVAEAPPTPALAPSPPAPVSQPNREPQAVAALAIAPPIFSADYLENPAPVYPGLSRRMREQGRVILRVLVRSDGTTARVEVRTSSGHARLDDAAREAVQHWKFVPAKRGPEPVEAWVLIPVSFQLDT